ncbi:MAG: SsrA-binding protein SmpB [Candidatus Babeliales bacterium]|jgi:SsrA-binding protein
MKIVAQNKKAYHDYEILDTIEAGVVLTGAEVKSLRAGHVSLIGAFATFHQGELFLTNCRITPYEKAFKQDESFATRRRKLLLHKRQLDRFIGDVSRKGITIIPLRIYFNKKNKAKIELGIGKHKKAPSKKKELKERDIKRQTRRELKGDL